MGLEVHDNGSGIDPDTTRTAKELTAALRERARSGTGPYTAAPNGEKELIDEKLLNNCDSEAPACMSAIGTELSADLLMYGKIEKSGQGALATYKVSLKLLYVARKQLASSTVETLPVAEATGTGASGHAKSWYAKLIGVTTGGTVIVRANVDRATVLVDDEARGTLTGGTLTVGGILEGRHTLAIEAKDYQRYETQITVRTGETLPHTATLAELPKKTLPTGPASVEGTVSTKSSVNVWKPVFYGSVVLAAGAGAFSFYEWKQAKDHADKAMNGLDNSACGKSVAGADNENFKKACTAHDREIIGAVVAGVFTVAAIGTGYLAFFRERAQSDARADVPRKKRREFVVTPIVSPTGGGATLQFDW